MLLLIKKYFKKLRTLQLNSSTFSFAYLILLWTSPTALAMAIANRWYTFYCSSFISFTFETLATKFRHPPLRNASGKSTPSSDLPSFSRPPNSIPNSKPSINSAPNPRGLEILSSPLNTPFMGCIIFLLHLTLNGKPFLDSTTIPNSLIPPLSTLILRTRFLGSGGDGGATGAASRDCYLNMFTVNNRCYSVKLFYIFRSVNIDENLGLINPLVSSSTTFEFMFEILKREPLMECLICIFWLRWRLCRVKFFGIG